MAEKKSKKKDEKIFDTTKDWAQYEEGIKYKENIKLFATVKDNYNFFIGKQWEGLQGVDDLPKPVFNFIQPIIRYKRATVMANDTKIIYAPMYTGEAQYDSMCSDVCEVMTMFAATLRENLKMDYHDELLVTDAAIAGCAYTCWRFDTEKGEVVFDPVDVTNIFPGDVNTTELQNQPYIIISYRKDLEQLKQEALVNMKDKSNSLTEDDIENLAGDNENRYESGEFGSKEMTDGGKPTKIACLSKYWRDAETKTIHLQKSVKNFVILADYDTGLENYPIAGMTWEPNKNSFFGISDITSMIPNQKFVNKIAAMMEYSTLNTAFPKALYNGDLIEKYTNKIGEAIEVRGANELPMQNTLAFVQPPVISSDAMRLFDSTINLSKELHSASDAALGTANTTSASGRAILLQMEASATPLETTRRRFYSYMEDVARIWFDLWRVYQGDTGKQFSITDEMGNTKIFNLNPAEITNTRASVRVDVGPCSRYSEAVVAESLDNLLMQKYIPFEWWVEWIPDSLGMPKADMKKKIQAAQQTQQQAAQQQAQQQAAAAQKQQATAQQQGQAPQPVQRQPKPQAAQPAQAPEQNVSDEQVAQLAQSIAQMDATQAKAALSNLGKKYPQVAARVLQSLPPEKVKELQAA